ncbi:hypothetical protein OG897_30215 [Streptomyces sp. NBC_00237]|uniref:hypothetical protein n=1 Tax=Streptomyces sp. NBC_00237 TaxID=2975687 RepID=UPI0022549E9B|nr:hypothetical protein [Streptomyces sp. NBC_00237]MCX5205715.1 hypothetical protein [Streptomyces sp. NBC_00237]
MTVTATTPQASTLFAYADELVEKAAASQWPGAPVTLGAHVPSVTGYVRRLEVGRRPLFAKVSVLGVSLVSALRGTCGTWEAVQAAQAAYTASPGALLERETAQLGLLTAAGLRAAHVAAYRDGVQFTEPVEGPTLGDLVADQPHRTADLMTAVRRELALLQRPDLVDRADALAIRERSIDATFARKFNGLSGGIYLSQAGECGPVLTSVVSRLRRLRLAPAGRRAVAFGDLKPEHAVFPDGPGGRPVFLDPGLSLTHPCADPAKLISRMVLGLIARPPQAAGVSATVTGIGAFIDTATAGQSPQERAAWLRHLVVLWLMDTTNIVTTYLTAPASLPLPERAEAVCAKAGPVCVFLDRVSARLLAGTDPRAVRRLALSDVVTAARP